MPGSPEVTVVVVSYNHAAFVKETLDSIAEQSHAPSRILIIDDASTDNSAEVIAAWAQGSRHETRVDLRTTNRGLCRNLNAALVQVTTPLYTYISADDRMLPQRLQRQVEKWVDGGGTAAAVYSDALRIDQSGERRTPNYREISAWSSVPTREGHVYDHLLTHNWIPAASVLLNTSAVVAAGGYDNELFYEDHDLWLRLARAGDLLCVDEPLVEIRELDSSLGATHFHADDMKYQAARLQIMLKNFGASVVGDRYLRSAMPVLAVKLWQAGSSPDLVEQALMLTAEGRSTPGLTARLLLLRAGLKREPRPFRVARTVAGRHRTL